MRRIKKLIAKVDAWQRRHRTPAVAYGMVKKFSDDQANLLVVALGWYGFTAIYPLLLVVVTVFGYVGAASLGSGIVSTLHQFPVIGTEFNPAKGGSELHGSIIGLVIGVLGLLYGAQGVTQTALQAMNRVWNVPKDNRPGFLPRLGRSVAALVTIGVAFVVNALVASVADESGHAWWFRVVVLAGLLVLNVGFFLLSFRLLTAPGANASTRDFLPGAGLGALAFTVLITVGAGLVQHELKHASNTYGAFASVIGVVTFLLLLSKLTLYAAELNAVIYRNLWPRALPTAPQTEVDKQARRKVQ